MGPPSVAELDRHFLLDDKALGLIEPKRLPHTRLGFTVQLTTFGTRPPVATITVLRLQAKPALALGVSGLAPSPPGPTLTSVVEISRHERNTQGRRPGYR